MNLSPTLPNSFGRSEEQAPALKEPVGSLWVLRRLSEFFGLPSQAIGFLGCVGNLGSSPGKLGGSKSIEDQSCGPSAFLAGDGRAKRTLKSGLQRYGTHDLWSVAGSGIQGPVMWDDQSESFLSRLSTSFHREPLTEKRKSQSFQPQKGLMFLTLS